MQRYITSDGERYEAETPIALVKQMMKTSWDTHENLAAYMASVADRTMRQNGTHIVHDTPETFVASLIGAGLLEQVENKVVRVVNNNYRAPKRPVSQPKGTRKNTVIHDPWAGTAGPKPKTVYAAPAPAPVAKPAQPTKGERLYLAYGSNLHRGQMRQRCPSAKALGSILLQDARLVFRGVADVEYAPGEAVPCGLWRITPSDEAALDRYEGVGGGHYVKELVELTDGREALIYIMTSEGIAPPSEYYADVLRTGYRHFELDKNYLDRALRHSWTKKEHDEQTLARRGRQRQSALHRRLARMPERVAISLLRARASNAQTEGEM